MGKSKYVVTITRQFGSMGRPIAKKMAEKLGIEYYDRDIVDQAAKKLNLPVSVVDEVEETAKKVKSEGVRILLWKRWKMSCIFTFMHHMRFVWSIV